MRPVTITAAFLSSMALATPLLEKRYIVTSLVLETATVTVTDSHHWWSWGRPTRTPAASNTISIIQPTPSESQAVPTSSTSDANSPSQSFSAYAEPILRQHNLHRDNHSAPALVWDNRLASIAQDIASSCVYGHNTKAGGGGYGQNIGAGAPADEIDQMITNQMYNDEMMLYPGYGAEPDMTNFEKWGHFSQIVWKSTTSVGCYTQHCPGGLENVSGNVSPYFTVCNYGGGIGE